MNNNEKPAEVFLDSSIHITKFESEEFCSKINQTLQQFPWKGTAAYTKVEFGNVILSCACYYYRKLEELGDLEKLQDFLLHRLAHNKKYKQWSYSLLRSCFNKEEATERASLLLRTLMTIGTEYISRSCDEIRNGTKCGWAEQRIGPRHIWQKPNRPNNCHIDHFFAKHQDLFCRLKDVICVNPDKQTEELKRFVELIEKGCKNPSDLKNCNTCRDLADAIIAVEGHGYGAFFTQNIKESDILCRPLGQLLLYLQQDSGEPVLYFDYR